MRDTTFWRVMTSATTLLVLLALLTALSAPHKWM